MQDFYYRPDAAIVYAVINDLPQVGQIRNFFGEW